MRYVKLLAALSAGLVVAVPALVAAMSDNTLTLSEGLTVLALFVPAVAVALSPANKLDTGELVKQAIADPNIDIKVGPASTQVPPKL